MIKIGLCCHADLNELAEQIGFDYIELNFTSTNNLTEEEFLSMKEHLAAAPLPVLALNCMVPGNYPLCKGAYDKEELYTFLRRGYDRAAQLGADIVVFGSGNARRRPDDMEPEEAYRALSAFLQDIAPIAAEYGITLAVEPLRPAECNILNSVSEVLTFVERVNQPNVRAMADQYHMYCGKDPYSELPKENVLAHAHIACPEGRVCPLPGDGYLDSYRDFLKHLKAAGYEGGVSVECNTDRFSAEELNAELLKSLIS